MNRTCICVYFLLYHIYAPHRAPWFSMHLDSLLRLWRYINHLLSQYLQRIHSSCAMPKLLGGRKSSIYLRVRIISMDFEPHNHIFVEAVAPCPGCPYSDRLTVSLMSQCALEFICSLFYFFDHTKFGEHRPTLWYGWTSGFSRRATFYFFVLFVSPNFPVPFAPSRGSKNDIL